MFALYNVSYKILNNIDGYGVKVTPYINTTQHMDGWTNMSFPDNSKMFMCLSYNINYKLLNPIYWNGVKITPNINPTYMWFKE